MDLFITDVRSVESSFTWFERQEFPNAKPEVLNYHLDSFLKEMMLGKTFGSNFTVKGDTIHIAKEAMVFTTYN